MLRSSVVKCPAVMICLSETPAYPPDAVFAAVGELPTTASNGCDPPSWLTKASAAFESIKSIPGSHLIVSGKPAGPFSDRVVP